MSVRRSRAHGRRVHQPGPNKPVGRSRVGTLLIRLTKTLRSSQQKAASVFAGGKRLDVVYVSMECRTGVWKLETDRETETQWQELHTRK